jgi:hypothetical protein
MTWNKSRAIEIDRDEADHRAMAMSQIFITPSYK